MGDDAIIIHDNSNAAVDEGASSTEEMELSTAAAARDC